MSGAGGGSAPRGGGDGSGSMSFVEAVSRIQRYHVIEKAGRGIPSGFLTSSGALSFFFAGLRTGLRESALLALLLPLAMGVRAGAVPAFGAGEADFFAKCLVFLFCFGTSLAAAAAAGAGLSGYRGGELARKAVDSLVWGRAAGLIAGAAAVFLLFHALLLLAGPGNVWRFSRMAGAVFLTDPEPLYSAITGMREPVRASAYVQLLCSAPLGFLPFLALRFSGWRRRRRGRRR